MACYLVTFRAHPPDQGRVRCARIVDLSFPVVDAGNKKRCFGAVRLEDIKDVFRINERTVIVCYRNGARLGTSVYSHTAVQGRA